LLILRKIEGTVTSVKYCDLLAKDVLPILKDKLGNFLLQQDNARPHTSKSAMSFFEANNVKLLDWPPHNPDLSPIEKIWAIIKKKLYNGPHFCTQEALWTAIQNIGVHIHVEHPTLLPTCIPN